MSTSEIEKLIEEYGGDILRSQEFALARAQRHHLKTSIGAHSLRVARTSLRIASVMERIGVRIDRRSMVVGALCHDFGLIDRDRKYQSGFRRLCDHPKESERIALRMMPDMEEKTRLVIRRHMFPLPPAPPNSGEGFAVLLADKVVSVREMIGGLTGSVS